MLETVCVLVSLSSLPFSILLIVIFFFKAPSKLKSHFLFYAIIFGMISYCYNPIYEIDLTRYFQQLDYCRYIPITDAFTWADDGLVVKNFVFWIISKTGDNHLLPLLSMTIVFGVSTYITVNSNRSSDEKITKVLLFQLLFIPFFSAMSNVRNVSAYALIILAIYRDVSQNKRNLVTVLLYILPCFIHMTGFVLLIIRILLILVKRHPVFGITLTLGIPTASIAIYEGMGGRINLPGNIGKIISRAIWKAYASSVNTSAYAIRTREGGYFTACRIITFILFTILLIALFKQMKKDNSRFREFKVFCGIIMGITLVWISIGTVKYWVFAFAAIICCSPIVSSLDIENQFKTRLRIFIKPTIVLSLIVRFSLEIYYISQRIDIIDYLTNAFTFSLWLTIAKGLKNLASII